MHIPDAVHTIARDLGEIFGGRLESVVAYGLAAAAGVHPDPRAHGAPHDGSNPVHTLAMIDALTHRDLQACAARVAAWHEAGLATPLLLVAREFDASLDAFPLELSAILADHVVVSGRNPFDALTIDAVDLRRACEVQARSHLLHLREGFLETRGRGDALSVLIVRSAAPFAALLKSIARLEGAEARDASAAGRHAERRLDVAGGIVTGVVALADVSEISSEDAIAIFPRYLDAVERLVAYVDGWSAQ
ncbi:MAG TPA: hypothetical protein VG222_08770 [Vicinamibacterales bacterium]|jgi:hypothetical protein|nr:hypothetical protein [Vicinamibacterales bacterium]